MVLSFIAFERGSERLNNLMGWGKVRERRVGRESGHKSAIGHVSVSVGVRSLMWADYVVLWG